MVCGIISCLREVEPGFIISFVAGELLPDGIARVAKCTSAEALICINLFPKRQIIMPRDTRQQTTLIQNYSRRAELIRHQVTYVR